jgi:VCBS repeat-containing protein/predicted outer membrane repeat protein
MEAKARRILIGGGAAATAAAGSMSAAPTAQAATFTVENLNDSGPGSLRQAIDDANGTPGADEITFAAGVTGTIVLTSGQLPVTDSVVITGPGPDVVTISGNDASRVFYLYNGNAVIDVTISGLAVRDGRATEGAGLINFDEHLTLTNMVFAENHAFRVNNARGDGGALWLDGFDMHFDVVDTVISGNTAEGDGGGVYVEDSGEPSAFTRVTVTGNTATEGGGGIYFYDPDAPMSIVESTISGNTAGDRGGGVYLYSQDDGRFLIDRSTISGNTAALGGGVYMYSPGAIADDASDPTLIVNSTISGNTATQAGGGVMLYDTADSDVSIVHSTITSNSAPAGGGIDLRTDHATPTIGHTIVAGNTADAGTDISSVAPVAASFSLIGVSTGLTLTGPGNIVDVAADLGTLADNGGVTQTHLPNASSLLIDAGDPAVAGAPATDQRGVARIVNGTIDIGAVEVVPPPAGDEDSTAEDVVLTVAAPGVLANDVEGFGAALAGGPANGTLQLNADGSYVYTPNANFNGSDSFTYQLTGPGATAATATVTLQVTPVNDAPVAVEDEATATEGEPTAIPVLDNDSDVDGDPISVVAVTQGTQGTVTIDGANVIYTPAGAAGGTAAFVGTDTFTYTVSDGALTAEGTVTVTVGPGPTTIPSTTSTTTTTPGPSTSAPTTSIAAPTTSRPMLPATGNHAGRATAVAVITLAVGATLTLTARRRRRPPD